MAHQRKQLRKPSEAILHVLAANVRAHRARLRFSQEDLAAAAKLHRTYIGAVERSERNVTLSSLEALASALRVTVADLLTPSEDEERG